MRADEGFKLLFANYPLDAWNTLCPATIVNQHGVPTTGELIATEALPVMLQRRSRYMDLAIRFAWADGRSLAMLLVEHWSDARKVDLYRVLRYVAELAARHPGLGVLPVIVVSDPAPGAVSGDLDIGLPGWTAAILRAHVIRLPAPDIAPTARDNRVALVLSALPRSADPIGRALALLRRLSAAPGPQQDLHWLLPLVQGLLKLSPRNERRLLDRLHRETTMLDIAAILKAEGKAEGKAEATIAMLRTLIARGRLSVDEARTEVENLCLTGGLSRSEADAALAKLG